MFRIPASAVIAMKQTNSNSALSQAENELSKSENTKRVLLADEDLIKGNEELNQGNYFTAIECYERALNQWSTNMLFNNIALAYRQLGNYVGALSAIGVMLRDVEYIEMRYKSVVQTAQLMNQVVDNAILGALKFDNWTTLDSLRQTIRSSVALGLFPIAIATSVLCISVLEEKRNCAESIAEATSINKDQSVLLTNLAWCRLRHADCDIWLICKSQVTQLIKDAERDARRAVRLDPENVKAHYWLARALHRRDRLDKAFNVIQCALELHSAKSDFSIQKLHETVKSEIEKCVKSQRNALNAASNQPCFACKTAAKQQVRLLRHFCAKQAAKLNSQSQHKQKKYAEDRKIKRKNPNTKKSRRRRRAGRLPTWSWLVSQCDKTAVADLSASVNDTEASVSMDGSVESCHLKLFDKGASYSESENAQQSSGDCGTGDTAKRAFHRVVKASGNTVPKTGLRRVKVTRTLSRALQNTVTAKRIQTDPRKCLKLEFFDENEIRPGELRNLELLRREVERSAQLSECRILRPVKRWHWFYRYNMDGYAARKVLMQQCGTQVRALIYTSNHTPASLHAAVNLMLRWDTLKAKAEMNTSINTPQSSTCQTAK